MSRSIRGSARATLALCSMLIALPAGADGLNIHGLLDVGVSSRGEGFDDNLLTHGDSPFDPYGVRLFADRAFGPRLAIFTQGVLHEIPAPYVEGAYLVYTPNPSRDLHLIAGKMPWTIGTFAPRSYSDHNPLIGKPLLYQFPTTPVWYKLPTSADALLAMSDEDAGYGYLNSGSRGMVVVDDSWWDTGVALTGSMRPLEAALAATTGTPGWGNGGEDENRGKSVMGRIGFVPVPGLRAGVSGSSGPYLIEELDSALPAGKHVNDYHQRLGMADLELERGRVEARAEGFFNTWQTPYLGDLDVHGGYAELRCSLVPGVWAALRGDRMRFSDLRDSTGSLRPWDHDRDRFEFALGYRPVPQLRIKADWQRNIEHYPAGRPREHNDLFALQATVTF
jgi:hypothetical protein